MLTKDCSSYTVYLMWLQSSTRELQWLQYLKSVFLEIYVKCDNLVGFAKIRSLMYMVTVHHMNDIWMVCDIRVQSVKVATMQLAVYMAQLQYLYTLWIQLQLGICCKNAQSSNHMKILSKLAKKIYNAYNINLSGLNMHRTIHCNMMNLILCLSFTEETQGFLQG